MKKALLAVLLAGGVSVGNANEMGALMASCERPGRPQAEITHCQQVLASLWFQADAVARAQPNAPVYTPSYTPQTKCTAVQNVFGNWDMRCY